MKHAPQDHDAKGSVGSQPSSKEHPRGRHSSASIKLAHAAAEADSDAQKIKEQPSNRDQKATSKVVEAEPSHKPESSSKTAPEPSYDVIEVHDDGTPVVHEEDRAEPVDPAAYPYGKEGMLELSSSAQPTTAQQQFRESPRVIYPNGESLSRPLSVPDSARIGVIALVIAACAIALVALYFYFDATTNEPRREQEQLQQQLNKDVSLDLPNLLSFVEMDDAAIAADLEASGATLFQRKSPDTDGEYEVIKLPSDMTLADAAALYAIGINKLSASQAVSLLHGSWDLKVDHKAGLNLSLHYADFSSGSVESAIANAVAAEDLERGGVSDSGEDDGFGNAYSNGTIMISGESYSWTVSAIPLMQVYSLSGIPDDAVYVGIRIKSTV